MPLVAGARLGPYEVVDQIGAGGMGEVYRATDTNLKRSVALKVLPASVAGDTERLARFQREAELLARLNHPNIAHIHGLERSGTTTALVMELVDGATLEDVIARAGDLAPSGSEARQAAGVPPPQGFGEPGRSSLENRASRGRGPGGKPRRDSGLPLSDALAIARQIAQALEAAHEHGIIHRDLKPANIKVRPDGTVKVLDFGLAKALESSDATGDTDSAPTITSPAMTARGVILGTAAYMSPEQARGRAVDRRADLWAFGVVLYETLTGRRLFEGESVADTLSQVLTKEPDWAALPHDTPAQIRQLLGRCLTKDPRSRLDSAVAARLDIDSSLASPGAEVPASLRARTNSARLVIPAMALVALLTAVVTWFVTSAEPRPPGRRVQFSFVPTPDLALSFDAVGSGLELSPDGRYLAYTGTGGRIMLRALDELAARPLPGVADAWGPFFSPDSRWIGFFTRNELKKMAVTGGAITTICRGLDAPVSASWGDDNTIVFSSVGSGLRIVSADGGQPTLLPTRAENRGGVAYAHPLILPGSRALLFTIWSKTEEDSEIALLDLRTNEQRTLLRGGVHPSYVNPGYLVYEASETLFAVAFDPDRLTSRGKPVAISQDLRLGRPIDLPWSGYTTSLDGTVAFIPASPDAQRRLLVWVDRKGVETAIPAPARAYDTLRLSPDGTRLAVSVNEGDRDIWVWDFARETSTRVTSGRGTDYVPVWTPDGRQIVFQSDRDGSPNLYRQNADGSGEAERLTEGTAEYWPNSITADGATLLGAELRPGALYDIVRFLLQPTSGSSPAARPTKEVLLSSAGAEFAANISPDGHYFAYEGADVSGGVIYVRPYPNANERRWQISAEGGSEGVWARNGRELFYRDRARNLMTVPIQVSGSTLTVGKPQRVFDRRYWGNFYHYDVSPKGERFVMIKEGDRQQGQPTPIVFFLNWTESFASP